MDGDGSSGIVWMVDGREVPFETTGEPHRPWLEESSAWGEPGAPSGRPEGGERDDGSEPPRLLWV